ncbi:hypothetical protein [Methanolobus psychrotolerans]|uniref:hypothetical protein n=1 Tax=Methanolobus psychrotolerans TaxID=1874706 RepID=UPI00101AD567|nr:hypothetical protein [Methanolobus psychrotolerans]
MRVDTKWLNVKGIITVGSAILILLLLSNMSLAEVAGAIKDEIGERDVLGSLGNIVTDSSKSSIPPSSYRSYSISSSNTGSGSNTGPSSNSGTTGSYNEPAKTDLYSQMKRYTVYYNNGIDEVPDVVKKVAGNDVIVLEITKNDNTNLKIKAVTKDGLITEFREVSSTSGIDPSVSVSADETTIRSILSSDDPTGQLSYSLNNGDLDIECKGFLKKAALAALKAFA